MYTQIHTLKYSWYTSKYKLTSLCKFVIKHSGSFLFRISEYDTNTIIKLLIFLIFQTEENAPDYSMPYGPDNSILALSLALKYFGHLLRILETNPEIKKTLRGKMHCFHL
jgi:hypothetical protein